MLSKKIGIDLGTSTVLIYVKGVGVVVNEPSLVAVDREHMRILAVGRQASEMAGTTPESVQVVRPMHDGAIADFAVTEGTLRHLIGKVQGRQRLFRPEIMICVPSGVTSVERRAVTKAAISAGARQVWLIDEPIAAAMGAGLPIAGSRANAICEIGGGTTEIAVICRSGMVVAQAIRVGGNRFDEAIAAYVSRKYNLVIDARASEAVKVAVGSALTMKQPVYTDVCGQRISSNDVCEAIQEPLRLIATAIREVLDETPRELAADVADSGVVLSGGGAQLPNLDRYLSAKIGIPVTLAAEPQTSVVRGAGLALENFEVLKRNQGFLH